MDVLEPYLDSDGNVHWPDAFLGKEAYYGIEWGTFLANENDTITGASWTVPTGLTEMEVPSIVATQTRIKLSADVVGVHIIECTIATIEAGDTQSFPQRIYLTVK